MRKYVGEDAVEKAQSLIDALPTGSVVGLAYNEDTCRLNFEGKKLIEVCDIDGLISQKQHFDVTVNDYKEEHLDLCVLGIGYKGQIGLNEVATQFDTLTHEQKLTESTKKEYAFLGAVSDIGTTMGIKSICSAGKIIVLALGEIRADAVFGMFYGRDDSTIPAAFLQIPPDVDVFLDEAAASKL